MCYSPQTYTCPGSDWRRKRHSSLPPTSRVVSLKNPGRWGYTPAPSMKEHSALRRESSRLLNVLKWHHCSLGRCSVGRSARVEFCAVLARSRVETQVTTTRALRKTSLVTAGPFQSHTVSFPPPLYPNPSHPLICPGAFQISKYWIRDGQPPVAFVLLRSCVCTCSTQMETSGWGEKCVKRQAQESSRLKYPLQNHSGWWS